MNGLKYFNMDCIAVEKMYHSTYNMLNLKSTTCQTDFCNSYDDMHVLENATLCEDGFYL